MRGSEAPGPGAPDRFAVAPGTVCESEAAAIREWNRRDVDRAVTAPAKKDKEAEAT